MTRFLGFCLALCISLALCNIAWAEERIVAFHSDITVEQNGILTITESITVVAEGDKIKRGIYRDFPLWRKDVRGEIFKTGFIIKDVKRSDGKETYGRDEPHSVHYRFGETGSLQIRIGRADVLLSPDSYTYHITYQTLPQITYLDGYDELYWNVTGNEWVFPIEKASATIHLPTGASLLQYDAYTGPSGSKAKHFTARPSEGSITFHTTAPLAASEGFTVAVSWPKGFVDPARFSLSEYTRAVMENRPVQIMLLLLVIMAGASWLIWYYAGRDPLPGAIVPLFTPPEGYSPAACHYIATMGASGTVGHTSSIVNIAVKGYWKIRQESGLFRRTGYRFELSPHPKTALPPLTEEETALLPLSNVPWAADNAYTLVRGALRNHTAALKRNYHKGYFATNWHFSWIGRILFIASFPVCFIGAMDTMYAPFAILAMLVCGITSYRIARRFTRYFNPSFPPPRLTVWRVFKRALQGITLAAIAYGLFYYLPSIKDHTPFLTPALILKCAFFSLICVHQAVFGVLIRSYTAKGRKIMDQIQGFILFLTMTEKDRLEFKTPHHKTPELFEAFLPYAIALGVENQWGEQFKGVFGRLATVGQGYSWKWADSISRPDINTHLFSQGLSSSLYQSSFPNISSSYGGSGSSRGGGSGGGSSGSGSSGGGGGGGGGGGW